MSPHTTSDCVECEYEIRPGDKRIPADGGAMHIACEARKHARKSYRFFLSNPPRDGYGMSLWFDAGDREYPILYNTGGLTSMASASKSVGEDAVEPSGSFVDAIAYSFHWLQSYRPLPTDTERIHAEIESELVKEYENEKVPSHERWAIHTLVANLYLKSTVQPELDPLVEYCDMITGFSVPEVETFE